MRQEAIEQKRTIVLFLIISTAGGPSGLCDSLWHVFVLVLMLALLIAVPGLSLWLPSLMK